MKKVYICSRYRADKDHTIEENVQQALLACRCAAQVVLPHMLRTFTCRNALMTAIPQNGQEFLKLCDEVWQWGATVSEGMAAELALAKQLGIPVKVFNGSNAPEQT